MDPRGILDSQVGLVSRYIPAQTRSHIRVLNSLIDDYHYTKHTIYEVQCIEYCLQVHLLCLQRVSFDFGKFDVCRICRLYE